VKRNYFLDSLKGIAILFVITTHFNFSDREELSLLFPYWIDMAVPMFMVISGYLYALSYERHGINTMEQAYGVHYTVDKVIRYTVPFALAYLVEMLLGALDIVEDWNGLDYFEYFVRGGIGAGSYYYPMMVQFVFLYPLVYFLIKKYPRKGLVFFFCANIGYEIFKWAFRFSGEAYRVLIFRLLFMIAFGAYLFIREHNLKRKANPVWMWAAFLLGVLLTYLINYKKWQILFISDWESTSVLSCVFFLPVMDLLIHKCGNVRIPPLEKIGAASYDVFLVQMVYYHFFEEDFYNAIGNRVGAFFFNFLVCVGLGLLFSKVEGPVTAWCAGLWRKLVENYRKKHYEVPENMQN